MAKEITAVEAREIQKKAIETIKKNPALFKVYTEVDELLCATDTRDAKSRYEVGVKVAKTLEDTKKYGEGTMELIAQALGYDDPQILYRWKKVSEVFPVDEFEGMLETRNTLNRCPTIGHFIALAKADSDKLRRQLFARWKKEALSVTALGKLVSGEAGVQSNNPNGKAGNNPSSLLKRLNKNSEGMLEAGSVMETAFELIEANPKKHADDELIENIDAGIALQGRVIEKATELRRQLEAARQKLVDEQQAQQEIEASKKAAKSAKVEKAPGKTLVKASAPSDNQVAAAKSVLKKKAKATIVETVPGGSGKKVVKPAKKLLKPKKTASSAPLPSLE